MKPAYMPPRLALLAPDPERREWLATNCRSSLPDARIEPARDMVDLMIRVAAGAADVVLVDGRAVGVLPEDGASVLKGLHAPVQVVIVDAAAGSPVPHRVDELLDSTRLGPWLARRFPEGAA
jgi:hypothetical protein